ncbi:MAG: trypsin-like serine peptidase [Syntrophothermus sp.]
MPTKVKRSRARNALFMGHLPASNKHASLPEFGQIGVPSQPTVEAVLNASGVENVRPPGGNIELASMNESEMLDAYWASYGTDAQRAALREAKKAPVPEVVIGTDERLQITSTTDYPWRCIASLRITAADGSGWIGTGWLVGPRILLTAGHVVYMADQGGWAQQIEIIPGRNGMNFPFGSCLATDFRSVQGWTLNRDSNFDYGAILLPPDNRMGDQLGWFGYQVHSDDALSSFNINVSGYPGDKPDGTQWLMSGPIKTTNERTFDYDIDTAGGQSGGPVWITYEGDDGRYGVGVHTNGALSGNSATRFVQDMFDNVIAWSNEVP